MTTEDDDQPFHRLKGSAKGLEFDVAAVDRLELVGRLAQAGSPFTRGQLIKPRPFAPVSFTGPCVVLELLDPPIRMRPQLQGTDYLFDIRIGTNCPAGHVHPLLAESWLFEPYTGLVLFGAAKGPPPPAGII